MGFRAQPITALPNRLVPSLLFLLLPFALLLSSHRAAADVSIPATCTDAALGSCPDCQRLTDWTFNFSPDVYAPSRAPYTTEAGCKAYCFTQSGTYWSLARANGETVCSCYSSCGSGLSTAEGLDLAVVGAVPFDLKNVGCRTAKPVLAGCFCPGRVPWGRCKYSPRCLGYMCQCTFHQFGRAVRDPSSGKLLMCTHRRTQFAV